MRALSTRIVLCLLLSSSLALAHKPRNPRGTRATGVTLTIMGALHVALLAAFIPLSLTRDNGSDASIIQAGVGYGGSGACAVLGSALLAVGVPLWVLGQRDLKAAPVSAAPTGIVVHF